MARRNGRKGQWLATDDYTGKTVYATALKLDYWGNYVVKPLKRNLQEIASPLNDPLPVPFFRGPTYEATTSGQFVETPFYVGKTAIRTPISYAAEVMGWVPPEDLGIGLAEIGTTFIVR